MIRTLEVHYNSEVEEYSSYTKAVEMVKEFFKQLGVKDSGLMSSTGGEIGNKAGYIFGFIVSVSNEQVFKERFKEYKPKENTVELAEGVTVTIFNLDIDEEDEEIDIIEVPRENLNVFISKETEEYVFPYCFHLDIDKDYEFKNKIGEQLDIYALDPNITLEERNGEVIKDKDKYIGTCKIISIERVEDKLNLSHRVVMVKFKVYSKINIYKEKCLSLDVAVDSKEKDDKLYIKMKYLFLVDTYKAKITHMETLLNKEPTFKTIFPDIVVGSDDAKDEDESRGNNLSGIVG